MATRNRYAEIMAQYAQSQPFSFTGYPSTYTGGYDVAQPQAYAAPVNRYGNIMGQGSMGGGGRPIDYNPEWTAKTDAEKAAFYAGSPFFSGLTQFGQNIFGFNKLGILQNAMDPGFVSRQKLIAQGIDPATGRYQGGDFLGNPLASGGFVQAPGELGRGASVPRDAQAAEANREPITETRSGGGGGYSNSNPGDPGRGGGGAHVGGGYAQGGYVSMQDLQGPNPDGPDDGYAALKDGEYVINDKAVNQYGIELMNLINSGKISKGELLGLLEM
jgi:hypothetical protein